MARELAMTKEEVMDFLETVFPQVYDEFSLDHLEPMKLTFRLKVGEQHLRPGGTISGPSMFTLADCAVYVAVMSMIGPEALTVTTSCSFDFMRKPVAGQDLLAETELLKLGKALAVADVRIHSEGSGDLVARCSMTYSIPPKQG